MKAGTIVRVIRDQYFSSNLRKTYWGAAAFAGELRALFRPGNSAFRGEVVRNQLRFTFSAVAPITGETQERARAAVDWILRAQAATQDDGVSLGYFPCDKDGNRWPQ